MSQVANEMEKELEGSNTMDDMETIQGRVRHKEENTTTTKATTKFRATMKIFLQRSSRIPIPFPENNAFCHFHPESSLCGAI